MQANLQVAAIVGSLRRESFTRRVVVALKQLMAPSVTIGIVPIADLPLYDEDADAGAPPASWQEFRDQVRGADAVLFATPEYNRSIPGGLKNAVDVGSRPYGASVWNGKPAAVLSASPGAIGGFGANHHLRQCLVFLNMPVLQQPEVYLGRVDIVVDEWGRIRTREAQEFLGGFAAAFEQWIRQQRKEKAT
jgi:chromate reductase